MDLALDVAFGVGLAGAGPLDNLARAFGVAAVGAGVDAVEETWARGLLTSEVWSVIQQHLGLQDWDPAGTAPSFAFCLLADRTACMKRVCPSEFQSPTASPPLGVRLISPLTARPCTMPRNLRTTWAPASVALGQYRN